MREWYNIFFKSGNNHNSHHSRTIERTNDIYFGANHKHIPSILVYITYFSYFYFRLNFMQIIYVRSKNNTGRVYIGRFYCFSIYLLFEWSLHCNRSIHILSYRISIKWIYYCVLTLNICSILYIIYRFT